MSVGGVMPFGFMGASAAGGWDLSNASYNNIKLDISGQVGAFQCTGVGTSVDSTKLYVADGDGAPSKAWQYVMTDGGLDTASYDNKSLDVSTKDSKINCPRVNNLDNKFYFIGDTNDRVQQYAITGGEVTPATYTGQSIVLTSRIYYGIEFNSDLSKVYTTALSSDIEQRNLTTPELASSITNTGLSSLDAGALVGNGLGAVAMVLNPDDDKRAIIAFTSKILYQVDLATAGEISTAVYSGVNFDCSSFLASGMRGLAVSSDGKKLYLSDTTGANIFQVDL